MEGELKTIITKKHCILGNHHHKIKLEEFTLLSGEADVEIDGVIETMYIGESILVEPNQVHSFSISKDSVLTCICSHPYNKNDDYE
jgi:quercetin dioxygenase-like cupin family protein